MQESTLTVEGETTLPPDVRRALGLSPGDRVRYLILDGGEVRLMPVRPVMSLSGLLENKDIGPMSLEDMEAAIGAGGAGEC
ncbi:MAG: type II toxin-antitoxin system PrlF family antitoxin [Bacteroidota bacterium]